MLKGLLKTLGLALCMTITASLLDIPLGGHLPRILFAVCGIFFSVAMSQIVSYDISRIINEKYFLSIKNALHKSRKSFVLQFICCGVAYLSYEIITSREKVISEVSILNFNFSTVTFFNALLICCLVYFVINFQELLKHKLELDSKIRQEALEE